MIDVVWSEILLIALLAFILLGPSDFLILLKGVGNIFSKLNRYLTDLKMAIDYEDHVKKNKEEE